MSTDFRWENVYLNNPPEKLPWNAGGPDPDLKRLVESGRIPVGQALDIGSGPGHDAVYLIQRGFHVIAIDISPTAVVLGRENASAQGLFGFFQQGDIRQIPVEDGYVDFAYDRGCFHVLEEKDRAVAVKEIARVLRPKGLFLLRVFSEKQPPAPAQPSGAASVLPDGPHRFTRAELEALFSPQFRWLDFWEGVFEGSVKPQSYSILMEKK